MDCGVNIGLWGKTEFYMVKPSFDLHSWVKPSSVLKPEKNPGFGRVG